MKVLVGLVLDREHVQRHDLGRAFEVGDGLHTTEADGVGHWSVDSESIYWTRSYSRCRPVLPLKSIVAAKSEIM